MAGYLLQLETLMRVLVRACLLALVVVVMAAPVAPALPAPSAVTDVNPDPSPPAVRFGGKIDFLAVDPVNEQHVLAASELGGLFRSNDGGLNWEHVDNLPLFAMGDVEFAPSDSSLVIATGDYDGRQTNGGGIWRSTDGGATWSQPATADPACTSEPSARHVAIAPTGAPGSIRIWVGTVCGIAYSANSGATWTHFQPNGLAGQVWDVQARALGGTFQVDACGDNGYTRSTTGGATAGAYAAGTNNPIPAAGFGPCGVATAPQDANTVYIAYFSGTTPAGFCQAQIDESTDGGNTWEQMGIGDQNCRFPYVLTHPALDGNANNYEVFAFTSVNLKHQTCDSTAAARCAPGNGNWPVIQTGAHPDPSDLAFDPSSANGCPILLANDGGVDRTTVAPAMCATNFTWADSNTGNHSLWLTAFTGTVDIGAATTELYIGTQDNGAYYTADGGASYTQPLGADVYDLFSLHNQPPAARILYRQCFGCAFSVANAGITGAAAFPLPPGDQVPLNFVATQFGPQSYAFITRDGPPPVNTWRLWVTTDEGANWAQMGPTPLPGVPVGPLVASGPAASPTFYVKLNGQVNRITGPFNTTATVTPANNGLTTPGTIAVDPGNPNRLYAYDASAGLMRSTNGGSLWTLDVEATALMRRGTEFKLNSSIGPLGAAITFDGNSPMIMAGTQTRGIIGSVDDGDTWFNVRGGEQLPRLIGFFFDERVGTIYAATAGRGLWRLDVPEADLRVSKSDSPDPVIAGEELFYTISVTNDGPDTASDIVVTDQLPSQVDYVTSTNPDCTQAAGVVTCPIAELASGAGVTFQIKVHVKPNAAINGPTTIFNNVSVQANESLDPDPTDNSDVEPTIVEDLADLEVTKLCKPDTTPAAGQPITCTIYVDNHGPSWARDVVLTDDILAPGAFTVTGVSASQGSCSPVSSITGGKRLTCNLGDLAAATTSASGRATVTYVVTSSEGQDINNVATVRSDTPDPDDTNNRATASLTVGSVADLALTKAASPSPVIAGTNITWTLTVTNNGPSTATNTTVADNVPAGVVVLSATGTGGASCNTGAAGDPLLPASCNFGSLPSGAGRTMTIVAKVLSATKGVLENDARAASETFDADNADNLATTTTTVALSADLALTFAADTPTTKPSSTIHYKATIDNHGPSDADGVVVTVNLPPLKSGYYVSDDGNCTLSNVKLTCPIGTLAAGAPTRTIFIDWFVQGSKFPIEASASVASQTPDPDAANNSASSSVGKK